MIQTSQKHRTSAPWLGCPSDEMLASLLDERAPDVDQARLISHLDQCDSCRRRLEAAAGDGEVWAAATDSLRAKPPHSPELDRVTASLRSSAQATRFTGSSTVEPDVAAILEPCEKGDCIGRLDQYEVTQLLGRGGMGFVFKARQPSLSRMVALKVLAAPLVQGEKARQRFRREAQAAASVRSEHVVAIHAIEDSARIPYLVMEYIDGASLYEYLKQNPKLAWKEIARIGAEIADGLAAAHSNGLVHRDIKPANILLDRESGRVAITDFGLARAVDDGSLTQTGCVIGTPEFMSPEQAAGESVGHQTDLFSLGSVLYAMCTGQPPFSASTTLGVLRRTQEEAPAPIHQTRSDVPADLVAVILKLLSKKPSDRYDNAADVAQALRSIDLDTPVEPAAEAKLLAPRQPTSAKPRIAGWLTLAAVLVFAAAIAASEITGVSNIVATAAGALGMQGAVDESENGAARQQPAKTDVQRIQIVTPDSLLREQIRIEKDKIPEAVSPHLIRKLEGHTGPVKGVAFSPDGRFAISGSGWPKGDRTLRLWDVTTGEELRQLDTSEIPLNPDRSGPREVPGEFMSVAFMPNGKQIVAGGTGGLVGLWDIETGKVSRVFDGHKMTVYDVAASPLGDKIISVGRDAMTRVWDVSSGDELLRIPNGNAWTRCVAFSPDGKRALIGTYNNKMQLWDLATASLVHEMDFKQWVWDVAFSPDGSRGVAVSGRFACVFDLDSGEEVLRIAHSGAATCVAYSPDGTRLLTGGYDMKLQLWDATTGKAVEEFLGHRGWIWSVAFSPDGRTVLSGGGGRNTPNQGTNAGIDFAVRLWKMPKRETRVIQPK